MDCSDMTEKRRLNEKYCEILIKLNRMNEHFNYLLDLQCEGRNVGEEIQECAKAIDMVEQELDNFNEEKENFQRMKAFL
jgi:hypothetical protein